MSNDEKELYRQLRKVCLRLRNRVGLINCEKCKKNNCYMKKTGYEDGCAGRLYG